MLKHSAMIFKHLIRTANTFSKMKHKVGDVATMQRKILHKDLEDFARLSGDTNPVHKQTGSNRAIVHGAFLNGLVSAVIGTKLPGPGTIVVAQTLNFPNKCYVDEEVTVTVELTEDRKISKVKFSCVVENEKKIVMYGDARLIKTDNI